MTEPKDGKTSGKAPDSLALFDLPGHHAGRYEQLMKIAIDEAIGAGRLDSVAAASGGALALAAGEALDLAVAARRGGTVSQVLMACMDIMRDYQLVPPTVGVNPADEEFWRGLRTAPAALSDTEAS